MSCPLLGVFVLSVSCVVFVDGCVVMVFVLSGVLRLIRGVNGRCAWGCCTACVADCLGGVVWWLCNE